MTTASPFAAPLPVLKGESFAAQLRTLAPMAPPRAEDTAAWADAPHQRILVPALIGGETMIAMTGMVAAALVRRGAEVTVLGCDAALPACAMRKVEHQEPACTRWCHVNARSFLPALGLRVRWISDLLKAGEREDIRERADEVTVASVADLHDGGLPLGEHVLRSMESHLRVGRIESDDPEHERLVRDFAAAAITMRRAAERVMDEAGTQKVLTADGTKILWGIPRDVALRRGLGVDILTGGPRGATLRVEPRRPGAPRRVLPRWHAWRDEPLTPEEEAALDAYMDRRRTRPYEHLSLGAGTHASEIATVRRACGLPEADEGAVVMAMFPNLSWDSGVTSSSPLYGTAAEWVMSTVEHLARRASEGRAFRLLVKPNPNEHHRMCRDPLVEQLARRFPTLPAGVHVLPTDTTITAQDLVRVADAALVYTSTVAAEAIYLETPVILAGGGAHAGHGVTHDMTSPEHYLATLDAVLADGGMAPAAPRDIARRYAYGVFFRSMIPAAYHEALDWNVTRLSVAPEDLCPGGDGGLDLACRAVMRDEDVDARMLWRAHHCD